MATHSHSSHLRQWCSGLPAAAVYRWDRPGTGQQLLNSDAEGQDLNWVGIGPRDTILNELTGTSNLTVLENKISMSDMGSNPLSSAPHFLSIALCTQEGSEQGVGRCWPLQEELLGVTGSSNLKSDDSWLLSEGGEDADEQPISSQLTEITTEIGKTEWKILGYSSVFLVESCWSAGFSSPAKICCKT